MVECLQWTIAPTDLNDDNPDPSLAPDVVSNSWICEPSEGCVDPDAIRLVVESVRAAGIVVVAGAGNNGPGCSSIQYPPGIHDGVITVGATDASDVITSFSSRGPVLVDGSKRLKPNVCAPGLDVRSAIPTDDCFVWAGTSMATPHVAGLVALLISANPDLAGQVDLIEEIIEDTALGLTTTQNCGGVSGAEIPNHTYGWGRIDAFAAYERAITATGIETGPVPNETALRFAPSAPNPSGGAMVLHFELTNAASVTLRVFDVSGRKVRTLVTNHPYGSAAQHVEWNGRNDVGRAVVPGTYFVHLEAAGTHATQRVTVVE